MDLFTCRSSSLWKAMTKWTECMIAACKELGIGYHFLDKNECFLTLDLEKPYYFVNWASPFGRLDMIRIFRNKNYTHQLLKDRIPMAKSLCFPDPFYSDNDGLYVDIKPYDEIIAEVEKELEYPVIVKPNSGEFGNLVSLCETRDDVLDALKIIYDQKSRRYDEAALVQTRIPRRIEYRAIFCNSEIELIYARDFSNAVQTSSNISPLHMKGTKILWVQDDELTERLTRFFEPLKAVLELDFLAADVIVTPSDEIYLLEINSPFNVASFCRNVGMQPIVEVFKKRLKLLI